VLLISCISLTIPSLRYHSQFCSLIFFFLLDWTDSYVSTSFLILLFYLDHRLIGSCAFFVSSLLIGVILIFIYLIDYSVLIRCLQVFGRTLPQEAVGCFEIHPPYSLLGVQVCGSHSPHFQLYPSPFLMPFGTSDICPLSTGQPVPLALTRLVVSATRPSKASSFSASVSEEEAERDPSPRVLSTVSPRVKVLTNLSSNAI
jgi:hypothetical protein